ncbi:MAG: twin-arginine translocase TatA/TatE family subunit [Desulfobulbaceae bacterium]
MFGIGLPEMIVILAVALIVVGPDKLPDMAKSLAKGVFELKKTLNQVKASLAEEGNLLDSVQSDLRKTTDDLKGEIIEAEHFEFRDPEAPLREAAAQDGDIIDVENELLPEEGTAARTTAVPDDAAEQGAGAGAGQEQEEKPAEAPDEPRP